VLRDSQSNPNRAAEVAKNLILRDKVDLMTYCATPETVNPVADQCELSGVPCLSNDAPLERSGGKERTTRWSIQAGLIYRPATSTISVQGRKRRGRFRRAAAAEIHRLLQRRRAAELPAEGRSGPMVLMLRTA
jgi:ABC-type branched-subunit amino acid transport system substrate-binding protein